MLVLLVEEWVMVGGKLDEDGDIKTAKEGGSVCGDWSECGHLNEWMYVAVSQMTTYFG